MSMPATTATEFDATFFRGLFGTDEASWTEFIRVSITSFKEAREQMAEAIATGDMETISKVRHAIGPSLTQWGAVTLERTLRQLDTSNMGESWPSIEPEFDALLAAFDTF